MKWTEDELTRWFGNSRRPIRGHWVLHTITKIITSPYDAVYDLNAQKWFVENNYFLVKCNKCIQV